MSDQAAPRVAPPALEVSGLQHTFHRATRGEVRALDGIDLAVAPGSFTIVLGRNGSGKSTLLAAIAGSVIADRGVVRLGGIDVTRWPENRRAAVIGRVFQNPFTGTAPNLTVAENLALAAWRRRDANALGAALGAGRRVELARRLEALGMGLEERLDTPIRQLSGGQRQALTLLMATLVRPTLLLLDEHTAALDPRSAEQVLRLTSDAVTRDALTAIMVTHSLQQAVRLGDRLIIMHEGRIAHDLSGTRKRRLRVDDLLDAFEQLRNDEMLDESAAELLERAYV